jgi:prepilin-type processing-associated H-X9-DG protein
MFGIGWMEVAIIMTIGVFWMTVFLTVFSVVMKSRSGHAPVATALPSGPAQSQARFSMAVRWHFFLVFVLFFALMISAPIAWLLLGNGGIPFVRVATIGVLLVALYAAIAIGALVITSKTPLSQALAPHAPLHGHVPAPQQSADAGEASAYYVARITQRFCPQCRAPLAADAPEGLCPACLMAGGMASAAAAGVNGMAVTTPPSGRGGGSPALASEWANLQEHFLQFEILELIGRGGMGAVYKARQKSLDRLVALKVIPPEAAKDPSFAERFQREAKAMARLNHPSIVSVYDFGQNGDLFFLAMEYVDGVNLRHALQASRLQPREALAIVPQICDALQYAHDQGVVHRDIKPENVLLDRLGRVKIADFGLAKLLGQSPDNYKLTQTQQVMGTPRYMAPEQIEKPTAVDHRADIYSLGVVIYEMLTGELPIGRFDPPSRKVQVDVRIDQVVLRTLEKEPDRRYQRASQLKTELASAASWPQTVAMTAAPASAQPVWQAPAPATKQHASHVPSSSGAGCILAVCAALAGILLLCSGMLVYLLVPAITSVRESAQRMQSMNSLKQLGIALHNYNDTFGSFPPGVVTDADGKPLYSGRVLLLPYLEQNNLYNAFDLTQPWNSPRNLVVSRTAVPVFMDPAGGDGPVGRTDYFFVTGQGTMFETGKAAKLTSILDGTSNTIAMVEVKGFGVNWAEPSELDLSQPLALPKGNHPGGNIVLFADGSVKLLSNKVTPADIRALATSAGFESAITLPP